MISWGAIPDRLHLEGAMERDTGGSKRYVSRNYPIPATASINRDALPLIHRINQPDVSVTCDKAESSRVFSPLVHFLHRSPGHMPLPVLIRRESRLQRYIPALIDQTMGGERRLDCPDNRQHSAVSQAGNRERMMLMEQKHSDRYVTFKGIDGDGNARQLVAMLRRYIDDPLTTNVFWENFKKKLSQVGSPDANHGRILDELFLVHSYINNIRELFEEQEDHEALALLQQIEEESC
jgi:N(2)-fixation sustaining protein CowN